MGRQRISASTSAEWAAICSDSFVPLRVRSAESDFRARLDRVELTARVGATRVASNSSEVYRSARVIAQEPRDDLLLSIHGTGVGTVVQDDRIASLRRGHATLYDASRPYVLSFPGTMSEIVLQVPRAALGFTEKHLRRLTARTIEPSASLRALTTLLSAATSPDDREKPAIEERAVADAAISLLRATMTPMGTGVPALHDRLALRIAMVEFIEEHLTDSALSVEAVAQHHHVSLRLAQQVFAEAGDSIAGHVRTRRLERARILLDGGATVADAGRRVGFGDLGTFTRAFKSSNGQTPRAYSAMMRAQPVTSAADSSI